MNRLFRHPLLLLLVGSFMFARCASSQQVYGSSQISAVSNQKYATDRILVRFRRSTSAGARSAAHASVGTHTLREFTALRDLEVVGLSPAQAVRDVLQAYRQRPEIEYAEPDYIVHLLSSPNDPLFAQML